MLKVLFFLTLVLVSRVDTIAQITLAWNGDTLKGNIKKMVEYRPNSGAEISVYTGDASNHTQQAMFFMRDHKYLGRWVAKFDTEGRVIESNIYCNNDIPCYMQSYKFNFQGKLVEERTVHYMSAGTGHFTCNMLLDILRDMITEWVTNIDYYVDITKYEYSDSNITRKTTESITYGSRSVDSAYVENLYKYDVTAKLLEEQEKRISSGDPYTVEERRVYNYADTNAEGMVKVKIINSAMEHAWPDTVVTYDYVRVWKPTTEKMRYGEMGDPKEYDNKGNITKRGYDDEIFLRREIEYY